MTTDLEAAKNAARRAATARRQGSDPVACGQALARHIMRNCPPPPGHTVSGFWPMQQEIDLRGLLHTLHERGNPVVLPVMLRRGNALTFRRWRPNDVMVAERFGTLRPTGEELIPAVLLVPLLAFDLSGQRLAYWRRFL